jgi:hypothetical protein
MHEKYYQTLWEAADEDFVQPDDSNHGRISAEDVDLL